MEDEKKAQLSTPLPTGTLRPGSPREDVRQINEEQPVASSRSIHGYRWFLLVLSVLTSTFFFGLDNTVVADVQPAIVNAFGSIERLPWISVAFLMGAASTNFF